MYRKNQIKNSSINKNDSMEGSSIEQKIERIISNKEAITDGAPIIFTERKEGVLPAYNIRTDRFELAVEGMDKIHKASMARREEKAKMEVVKTEKSAENNSGAESTQGTGN